MHQNLFLFISGKPEKGFFMKNQKSAFLLAILVVSLVGCNVHGKYTQTGPTKKDGKQEVKTYELEVETSKEEAKKEVKDSDKAEQELATEIVGDLAQLNAKVAALQAKTKGQEPLVAGGVMKDGKTLYVPFLDLAATPALKKLANPEDKAEEAKTPEKAEPEPTKKEEKAEPEKGKKA